MQTIRQIHGGVEGSNGEAMGIRVSLRKRLRVPKSTSERKHNPP